MDNFDILNVPRATGALPAPSTASVSAMAAGPSTSGWNAPPSTNSQNRGPQLNSAGSFAPQPQAGPSHAGGSSFFSSSTTNNYQFPPGYPHQPPANVIYSRPPGAGLVYGKKAKKLRTWQMHVPESMAASRTPQEEAEFRKVQANVMEAQREQARQQQKQRDEAKDLQQFQQEHEHDGMAEGDTFAAYVPTKLKIGLPHPDICVETATMSSVEPPDITYQPHLPEEVINNVYLSSLQLEAVVYACQSHEKLLPNGDRQGYLIGDGAGVGKGRTIAGIIFENYLQGRKRAVWLSVSADLIHDAERDLDDVDAPGEIEVRSISQFHYGYPLASRDNANVKNHKFETGVLYSTYSSLIASSSSVKNKFKKRMDQIVDWCGGREFDGILVFDECHRAKHLVQFGKTKTSTKTAQAVFDIQNLLPKARVVYASATGASEIRNTAFMTRLGMWGEGCLHEDFKSFCSAIEARGVAGLEITAMELKLRGLYCARQLSFSGASFDITEMPVDEDFIKLYNDCVEFWCRSREAFEEAARDFAAPKRLINMMWAQFYGAQQRFFKYLCLSVKAPFVAKLALDAVANGKCAVIGLQSTGEARTKEEMESRAGGDEIDDFVSTARATFDSLLDTQFPAVRSMLRIPEVRTDSKKNDEPLPRHRRAKLAAQDALTMGAKGGGPPTLPDSFDIALERLRAKRDQLVKEGANGKGRKKKAAGRSTRSNSVADSIKSEVDAFSWARSSESPAPSVDSPADGASSSKKKRGAGRPRKRSPASSVADSDSTTRSANRTRKRPQNKEHAGSGRRGGPSANKKRAKLDKVMEENDDETYEVKQEVDEDVKPKTRGGGRKIAYHDDSGSDADEDRNKPSASAAAARNGATSSTRIAHLRGGGPRGRPAGKSFAASSKVLFGRGNNADDCIVLSDDDDDAGKKGSESDDAASDATLTKAVAKKRSAATRSRLNGKTSSRRRGDQSEEDEDDEDGQRSSPPPAIVNNSGRPQRQQKLKALDAFKNSAVAAALAPLPTRRRAKESGSNDNDDDIAEVEAGKNTHRSPPKRTKTTNGAGQSKAVAVKDAVVRSPEDCESEDEVEKSDVDQNEIFDDEFGLLAGFEDSAKKSFMKKIVNGNAKPSRQSSASNDSSRSGRTTKASASIETAGKKESPVKLTNGRANNGSDDDAGSNDDKESKHDTDDADCSIKNVSRENKEARSVRGSRSSQHDVVKTGSNAPRGKPMQAESKSRPKYRDPDSDEDRVKKSASSDSDNASDSDFELDDDDAELVAKSKRSSKPGAVKKETLSAAINAVDMDDDDDGSSAAPTTVDNPASVQTVASSSSGTVSSGGYRPWDLIDETRVKFGSDDDDDDDDLPDPWMVALKLKRKVYIEAQKAQQAMDSVPNLKLGAAARKRNRRDYNGYGEENEDEEYDDDDDEDQEAFLENRDVGFGGEQWTRAAVPSTPLGAAKEPVKLDKDSLPGKAEFEKATKLYRELKQEFTEKLGPRLPPNPLDYLIDTLGGPSKVAELTGRKIRVARGEDGAIRCTKRNHEDDTKLDQMNMVEKRRFMDGEKLIAVISEAASSGISLQADRRVLNQLRRVHLTLELPWAAESAVQQFGRTHRSNQVSAPEYILITSGICGEHRFAASVAKRLNMLGALTRGDRRAADASDLTEFNVDTKYGRKALNHVIKVALGIEPPKDTEALREYEGIDVDAGEHGGTSKFVADMRRSFVRAGVFKGTEFHDVLRREEAVEKMISIPRFLNRLMCMHVHVQNAVFEYLNFTMETLLSVARTEGKLDNGIMELGSDSLSVKLEKCTTMKMTAIDGTTAKKDHSDRTLLVTLSEVSLNRGMTWEKANEMLAAHKARSAKQNDGNKDRSGFYLNVPHRLLNKYLVSLALRCANQRHVHASWRKYTLYKPNIGLAKNETYSDLSDKCKQALSEKEMGIAERAWNAIYEKTGQNCLHKYWDDKCMATMRGVTCDFGQRECRYHVLTGSLLTILSDLEYAQGAEETRRMLKLVRVHTSDDERIVGMYVPRHHLDKVLKILRLKPVNADGMMKGEYLATMPILKMDPTMPSTSAAACLAACMTLSDDLPSLPSAAVVKPEPIIVKSENYY